MKPWASSKVRVLDATTSLPVDSASSVAALSGLPRESASEANRSWADSDGRITIDRFPESGGSLYIEAPGYSSTVATEFDWEGSVADFGVVRLQPLARVDVRLTGGYSDPEWWSVDEARHSGAPAVHFDSTGTASLPFNRGSWSLGVTDPTGREERLEFFDAMEEDTIEIEWPVSRDELRIRFVGAEDGDFALDTFHTLKLDWESNVGFFSRSLQVDLDAELPRIRAIAMDGVLDHAVDWSLSSPSGEELAWGRFSPPLTGTQELVVDLRPGTATIEVVDRNGTPLPETLVLAFDEFTIGASPYIRQLETDENGRLQMPLLPDNALGIVLIGPTGGVVPRVDTSGWRAGEVTRVELDAPGTLRVEVVDNASAGGAAASVDGARVVVSRDDDALWLVEFFAGNDGVAEYEGLALAPYRLAVHAEGHWSRELPMRIDTGGSTPLTVVCPKLANLEVRVRDEAGVPQVGLAIELEHVGLGETVGSWIETGQLEGAATVTDGSGSIALFEVPAGEYRVLVDGEEVGRAMTEREINTVIRVR
ncbi:hypothetical protein Pla163_02740 [Planctomycetes bacterium Pla163]|uniref:Carboxypeptidase regulatory-like domain-containing protein n=1 Tax=Rohdeia mirabilis TaxID=2528008 RepID=A0A518CVB7_9BACT|nr:hypothetical protein Pla163_02740 [Planctomycetes bacterium Pla163]